MAKVKVILRPYLMGFANGQGEVVADGKTLNELFENLAVSCPSLATRVFDRDKGVVPGVAVSVNNHIVNLPGDLNQPLKDGDNIRLLLKIGGG